MFRTILQDDNTNAWELYAATMDGNVIEAEPVGDVVPARLAKVGEFFRMYGISGSHSISACPSATNPERLHAHWQGFKLNAAAKARAL